MKEIKFVDVGEGITEGHIRKWLVKDGDAVKEDDSVAQVETDKAVVNVPAPIKGTVKINLPEGYTLHIGDTLAYIGEPAELAGIRQVAGPAAKTAQAQQMPAQKADIQIREVLAAPSVRKMARDLNVEISKVVGTGPGGRILENDLRNFAPQATGQKPVAKFSEVLEGQHQEEIERIPLTQTRKAIARNMELSWTIPRAAHMELIDASVLFGLVGREKERMLKQFNVKLTFLPFIIKATVEALKENPNFNSSYDKERLEIIRKKYYNIGLAAETTDGLKVVVIKGADKKSIMELAKEIQAFRQKLDNNTITLDEMRDTTFTITNIGSLGGGFLSVPMINYPDAAILGIHIIRDWSMVANGQVKIGKLLPVSLTFDHRVVDGAEAVKFVNAIKNYLEDPDFLEMLD